MGDITCDGKDEKIIVSSDTSTLTWYLNSPTGASPVAFFGLDGDIPMLADLDGDLCDEFVVVRAFGGMIYWYYLDFTSDEEPRFIQWGLTGDRIYPPADLNGDGRKDPIIIRSVAGVPFVFC